MTNEKRNKTSKSIASVAVGISRVVKAFRSITRTVPVASCI